jgi:hypothetical protein
MTDPPTVPSFPDPRPVRIALVAPGARRARRRLEKRLHDYHDRVTVLRRREDSPDLVLFDPRADGRPLDLATLDERVEATGPVAVYTSPAEIDPLAFAMAGSLMDGRLRGWLCDDLDPSRLVEALERIHRGDVVVIGSAS